MKKILCILSLLLPLSVFALSNKIERTYDFIVSRSLLFAPLLASCPIDGGACTASSNWDSTPLQQKYLPNRLQNLQRTDAFQPNYFEPYHDALINTESASTKGAPTADYNSNCQFGVCLPGVESGGEIIE